MAWFRKSIPVMDALVFHGRNVPVPVIRWTGNRIQLSSGATTSAATALPTGRKAFEVRCTQDCYLAFGDDSVAATTDDDSDLFLRGVQVVPVPLDANGVPYTHVAVIRVDTDGVVQLCQIDGD